MDAKEALQNYQHAVSALEAAENNVQTALRVVKEYANRSTLEVEGRSYQIRERGGRLYLCTRQNKPVGRPKGSKNKKTLQREADALAQQMFESEKQPDLFGEVDAELLHEAENQNCDHPFTGTFEKLDNTEDNSEERLQASS